MEKPTRAGATPRPWPLARETVIALALGLVAMAVRGYRLATMPAWLDEIYGFLLVRRGLGPIVANSLSDPHPPGWYLLLWLTSGFGLVREELALRWPVALAGAATVPVVYALARRYAAAPWAALAALLLAFSPFHIYLSQDARQSALAVFLAAVAALGIERVLRDPRDRRGWALLAGPSLAGLYISYFFVLAVGGQLLGLLLLRRWREALAYGLALAVIAAPVAYLFFRVIPAFEAARDQAPPALSMFVLTVIGGDPLRYGWGWWHGAIAAVLLPLAALGALAVRRAPTLAYHIAQVVAPFAGFWLVAIPLLDISLPPNQIKHFLIVLPSLFVLVAIGLERAAALLPPLAGRAAVAGICALVIAAGLVSASHPWAQGKGPESDAAVDLAAAARPGEAVVVLHYSPSYALSFYAPGLRQYVAPAEGPAGWDLAALPPAAMELPADTPRVPLAALLAEPRLWAISLNGSPAPFLARLRASCAEVTASMYGPFELLRLERCAA